MMYDHYDVMMMSGECGLDFLDMNMKRLLPTSTCRLRGRMGSKCFVSRKSKQCPPDIIIILKNRLDLWSPSFSWIKINSCVKFAGEREDVGTRLQHVATVVTLFLLSTVSGWCALVLKPVKVTHLGVEPLKFFIHTCTTCIVF